MTPADTPMPEDFPPGWLAAYADGELDAAARAAVERWLADHPEAAADLNAQRAFGPGNAGLWERAEPAEPSEAAWAAVRRGIDEGLNPPVAAPRWWAWSLGGLAAGAVAAAAAWVAFGPALRQAPPGIAPRPVEVAKLPPAAEVAPAPRAVSATQPDPLAGLAVVPMADDDDVVLDRVPDTRAGWLPVGRHPLPDVLALASVDEVDLQEVDPSPAWPPGGPRMTTAPGDAPMLFAAKPR